MTDPTLREIVAIMAITGLRGARDWLEAGTVHPDDRTYPVEDTGVTVSFPQETAPRDPTDIDSVLVRSEAWRDEVGVAAEVVLRRQPDGTFPPAPGSIRVYIPHDSGPEDLTLEGLRAVEALINELSGEPPETGPG